MKIKPILFSTLMVQAILENRKTQTRRVCKHQHWSHSELIDVNQNNIYQKVDKSVSCPHGQVGDVLWVRETFRPKGHSFPIGEHFEYKATAQADGNPTDEPWKPSIFMPKDAARIWLKITDVRVERLQDISEEDAISEGVDNWTYKNAATPQNWLDYTDPFAPPLFTAYDSFCSLWYSINGEESWNANPWVWVIEFERIEKPIEL